MHTVEVTTSSRNDGNAVLADGWISTQTDLPKLNNKNEYIKWSDFHLGCIKNDKKVIVRMFNLKCHLKPKKHPYTDELMNEDYVYVQLERGVHRELSELLFWMPVPQPPSAFR